MGIPAVGKENVGDASAVGSNTGTLLRATSNGNADKGGSSTASAGASAGSVVAVICAAIMFVGAVVYTRRAPRDDHTRDAVDLEKGTGDTFVSGPTDRAAAVVGLPLVNGSPRNLDGGLENPIYNEQSITIVRGSVYRRESNVSVSSVASVGAPYAEPTYEAPADNIMGIAEPPIYAEASNAGALNQADYDVAAAAGQHDYASTYELASNM